MKTVIAYYNQAQRFKNGVLEADWHDICEGHEQPYDAIHCHERSIALCAGSYQCTTLPEILAQQSAQMMKKQGFSWNHRIIKATMTREDEVYDA